MTGRFVVPQDVEMVNLSLGGMAVESDGQLELGRNYRLDVSDGGHVMSLSGSVVWCHLVRLVKRGEAEVVPVYRAGVKFHAVSGYKVRELWDFIRENAEMSTENNLVGRYPIERVEAAELSSNYNCDVKTISLSGMLAETDLAAEPEDRFDVELRLNGWRWKAEGRVASVPPSPGVDDGEPLRLGIEFCDVSEASRARLERYIASCRS